MEKFYCKNCSKKLTTKQQKNNNLFCCKECKQEYERLINIKHWLDGEVKNTTNIPYYIKPYLLKLHNNKCELCGWGEINPYTNKIPLEVHHKDGNHSNNSFENLQLLCPNCHSLTENFRRSKTPKEKIKKVNYCIDCGTEISLRASRCKECENIRRANLIKKPMTREELKDMIRTLSFLEIGKKYGCSDNNIRKQCDFYNLPRTKKEIKTYSDEEWEKI